MTTSCDGSHFGRTPDFDLRST